MSSRERILAALRQNKPPPTPLPDVSRFARSTSDPVAAFRARAEASGIHVVEGTLDLTALLAERFPKARRTASTLAEVPGEVAWDAIANPRDLADLEVLVCPATLAVAENAALWVTEAQMGHRAAPFITQHLVLVVSTAHIVATMHDAYNHLSVGDEAFGCFIAGPSKTADIEQALVIGAHGPRSLTVVLR